MTDNSVQKVKFRPRARLLYIVGGDLIKDEMAGVIELVKNAYDADAGWVKIIFENLDKPLDEENEDKSDEAAREDSARPEPRIVIEDNGHGMSRTSIETGWLSPATGMKGREKTSPGGRPMLGTKGVGRFSAMRLGGHLVLETIPGENEPALEEDEVGSKYRIELGWSTFQKSQAYLDEVEIELESFKDANPEDHGVRLEITKLQDRWDADRIRRLIRELKLLLSPLPLEDKELDFDIYLDLDSSGLDDEDVLKASGRIEPYEVPEVADYRATAHIDGFGGYEFSYERVLWADKDEKELRIHESNEDIRELFRSEDRKRFSPAKPDEQKELPCGPLIIRFNIWDRDIKLLKSKADRLKDVEKMGVRAIRRLLDDMSGVSIYRDEFRVRPYGKGDEDWLGLGQRRVQQPVSRIGPNQLLGIIDISSENNPDLDDKSSREGLKENDAYQVLQACVFALLGWIEPKRYRFRERHSLGRPEPESTRALVEKREGALGKLREHVSRAIEDEGKQKALLRIVDEVEDVAEKEHERFDEQTRLLHDTHALGLLARFILHEGRNLSGTLDSGLSNIERVSWRSRKTKPARIVIKEPLLSLFERSLVSADRSVERLDDMLDQLDPLTRPRRSRRSHIVVGDMVDRVITILGPDLDEANIGLDIDGKTIKVQVWEADLFHALYNLFHNSVYWLQRNAADARKIKVEARTLPEEGDDGKPRVEIVVSDNGPGVSEEAAPYIFDLGYTEKPGGYGVGLFIAREAIERSRGSIKLLNPGDKGARFQIVLEGV